jgi:aspartyl-tRNA(Asn)/glutamyl-tRNA(Gln) amidotransferase subunit A
MNELLKLNITDALSGILKKEYTSVELVKAHVENINALRVTNAYVLDCHMLAIEKANDADNRYKKGENRLLEGIPVAVKDIFCTKGFRTTACSNILANFIPQYESTVTNNLFSTGAIMLGKTNMDEFAMGSANITSCFGPVKGPLKNKDGEFLVPGGSSGGSAAAVASYQAMAALGTDTGGSIRQPASFVGCVGIKPTYGRCSRYGIIAFSSSLDQAGVFARSVDDATLVLQSIMGYDPKDSTSSNMKVDDYFSLSNDFDPRQLRVGVPKEYNRDDLNPDIREQWNKSIDIFRDAGAKIVDISLPNTDHGLASYYIIAPAEASSNLARYDGLRFGLRVDQGGSLNDMYSMTRAAGFGDEVTRRILIGTYVLSSEQYEDTYVQAQKVRRLIKNDFDQAFDNVDIILVPSATCEAFPLNKKLTPVEMYMNDLFTIPASLAGLPTMSVPSGLSRNDLPLGMQIIARHYDELTMIKAAKFLEKNVAYKNIFRGI